MPEAEPAERVVHGREPGPDAGAALDLALEFDPGGRHHLRQALYTPALVAVRFNAAMQRNALLRDGRTWAPKPT